MAEGKFDDKETREILKAAAEIQFGISTTVSSDGMTLGELQNVAQEIGINPVHIQEAASELVLNTEIQSGREPDSYFAQHNLAGQLSEE